MNTRTAAGLNISRVADPSVTSIQEYLELLSASSRAVIISSPLGADYNYHKEDDLDTGEDTGDSQSFIATRSAPLENALHRLFRKKITIPIVNTFNKVISTSSLNLLVQSSAIDLISPEVDISYSPNIERSNRQNKLKQIITEIIETEESYLNGLKIVKNYYAEPLLIKNKLVPIPINNLHSCLTEIILIHSKLLTDLVDNQFIQDIDEFVILVAELIQNLINPFYYNQYVEIFKCVTKVVKDNEMFDTINRDWNGGWRNYLEASQPYKKKADLSFSSLIQNPVARVSKYKLLLMTLTKYCNDDQNIIINHSLEKLETKLQLINNKVGQDFVGNQLNKLINFYSIDLLFRYSSQFFGKPLLIGSLSCIYINLNRKAKLVTYGAILYKTHLILTKYKIYKRKMDIEVLIDLSKCKISQELQDFEGGIFSYDPFKFKIIFEYKIFQHEIMFVFLNNLEFDIWLNQLNSLVNVVNGPYNMDFSRAKERTFNVVPRDIGFYDIRLMSFRNPSPIVNRCYFQQNFDVEKDMKIKINLFTNVKRIHRQRIEYKFKSIWSEELPTLEDLKDGLKVDLDRDTQTRNNSLYITETSENRHNRDIATGTISISKYELVKLFIKHIWNH